MKPSLFAIWPKNSILMDSMSEKVAMRIMRILATTGDQFRLLSWHEYCQYRTCVDEIGDYKAIESIYFKVVSHLSVGNVRDIVSFSPVWRDAFIHEIKSNPAAASAVDLDYVITISAVGIPKQYLVCMADDICYYSGESNHAGVYDRETAVRLSKAVSRKLECATVIEPEILLSLTA